MDAFDAADFKSLLPRRWKKTATAALLFALLFPNPLRDIFIAQVERHAQHMTAEAVKVVIPKTSSKPAPMPAPPPLPNRAGPRK